MYEMHKTRKQYVKRNLVTTEIIINFLGLDLSNPKWCASHRRKRVIGERASLFKKKVARKILSSINWTGVEQDCTKFIGEGFYVTNFLFNENIA